MAKGTISDPRMNSREKDYGILIAQELDANGKCKEIIYLKDKVSRTFTFGSPVDFTVSERQLELGQSTAAVEVATDVAIDAQEIDSHPIVKNLNIYAKILLELSEEDLERLNGIPAGEIEECLKSAIDDLIGSARSSGGG